MQEKSWVETIKVQGGQLLEQVQRLINEGNVTRITVRQEDRVIAEFPLTVGVVGTVFAPVLAAVGVLAALLTNCTIVVERAHHDEASKPSPGNVQSSAKPDAESGSQPHSSDAAGTMDVAATGVATAGITDVGPVVGSAGDPSQT